MKLLLHTFSSTENVYLTGHHEMDCLAAWCSLVPQVWLLLLLVCEWRVCAALLVVVSLGTHTVRSVSMTSSVIRWNLSTTRASPSCESTDWLLHTFHITTHDSLSVIYHQDHVSWTESLWSDPVSCGCDQSKQAYWMAACLTPSHEQALRFADNSCNPSPTLLLLYCWTVSCHLYLLCNIACDSCN